MDNDFSIKNILKKVIEELDNKINHIRKPKTEEKERYSKSDFFVNEKTSKDFPISKDTYYAYSSFAKKEKSAKNLQSIDLRRFYDICVYTDVSADYYLGFTKSPRKEQSADMVYKEFGLSREAMKQLVNIHKKKAEYPGELTSQIINFILDNDRFWDELNSLLPTYFAEYINKDSHYLNRTKFELSETFIQLIDDVCKSLLIALADAEKKGISMFDNSIKKGRSYKSIIEECQKRGWVHLKTETE